MTRARAPRGAPDILPPDSELLSEVEDQARLLFDRYGYRRIETPVFEHTEVFLRSIGESSDIVRKEMYTFDDRKGRSLTLRPEGTAPVVRAFVEHRLDASESMPVRLYYVCPMFRYERPQKGRSRQFFQIGLEAIGSASPLVDAEVILLASEFYSALGIEPVILLNSMGCAADRGRYAPVLRAELQGRDEELCEDCVERLETNPLRVFDCKVPECRDALREVAPITEYLCDECRAHFDQVQSILEALGVAWKSAPDLVRGFDYYTRTVFEFDLTELGARSAIGGGGRYDGLVEEFGGPALPGVGMAVGVVPLMEAIRGVRDVTGWRPDVYVVWLSDELAPIAMAAAADLRRKGLRVLTSDEARSMRSQLRSADRSGARRVVILGPDEVGRGVSGVRDLESGEQSEVPLNGLAEHLAP